MRLHPESKIGQMLGCLPRRRKRERESAQEKIEWNLGINLISTTRSLCGVVGVVVGKWSKDQLPS